MNDLELVQSCIKGDKNSWGQFVDKYSRLIYSCIHNVLNSRGNDLSGECVRDLYQELFRALIDDNFKKLRSFRAKNGCSLATWLRQVTVNFAIDYLRKVKPVISIEEEIEDEVILKDMLVDNSSSAPEKLSQKELLGRLQECIEALNCDDKYFLELIINRRIELERLKDHLRISRGAVDMRKSRIISRLRDCFRAKGFALDL